MQLACRYFLTFFKMTPICTKIACKSKQTKVVDLNIYIQKTNYCIPQVQIIYLGTNGCVLQNLEQETLQS